MEARKAIADGASIIIARGLQASLIKQYTDIPVVEIVLTAQEMALLVMRARQIVAKSRPVIAVVGFRNMFCDMSYFDELYGIDLRMYFAEQGAQLPGIVRRAVEDGVDLVIGGDTAVSIATEAGFPPYFFPPQKIPCVRLGDGRESGLCHEGGEKDSSPDGNTPGLFL